MTTVSPRPDGVALHMPLLDILVLNGNVIEFMEQVGPESEPEPAVDPSLTNDPLAAWEQDFAALAEEPEEPDALTQRLFPSAYPDDPRASAEFRRYTEPELRRAKLAEATLVSERLGDALAALVGGYNGPAEELVRRFGDKETTIEIPADEAEAWLKVLTALRIRLGVELEVETTEDLERLEELPDTDPRSYQVSVFDWLGYVEEAILQALTRN